MERRNFVKYGMISGMSLVCSPNYTTANYMFGNNSVFQAGAAKSNITPLMDVPLDGVISKNGPATDVHDELFARCLVLDDGHKKLAIAVVDNTMISNEIIDRAKNMIHDHIGIPPEQVLISATHSHSTPRAVNELLPESKPHRDYLNYLSIRISEGVRRAANNLAPAQIGWGSTINENHVFNRRWWLKDDVSLENPFGGYGDRIKMNPKKEDVNRPAGSVDPEIFVLAVNHQDGRPLALLANYGLHYVGGIPRGTISADYYGVFSEKLAHHFDNRTYPAFVGMMSNGTSGDVNANNVLIPRKKDLPFQRMNVVAEDLMKSVLEVYKEIRWKKSISLDSVFTSIQLKVRKPDYERLAWAERTLKTVKNSTKLTRSQVYAYEAVQLDNFPDIVDVPLQSFRIDDLAIAAIPNEVFAETGVYIKDRSPFKGKTFIMELANGYHGYLPSPEQHAGGGYETWPARSSYLEIGAERVIRENILKLLSQLSG